MTTLAFALSPSSCARLHDILACLARFDEYVKIEAQTRHLMISGVNLSNTAHVAFYLDRTKFFQSFDFDTVNRDGFAFQMLNRALLAIFKSKLVDSKGGQSTLDSCKVELRDGPDMAECRLHIRMLCAHGVTKSYKLTYESVKMLHPLFSAQSATNNWKIHSSQLKEYMEFFAPKTENLDISAKDDTVTLVSYTEKVIGRDSEILKQPLESSIGVHFEDFESISVQDGLHVSINVKDFRHMVLHADTLRTFVMAQYSRPGRPLQFAYNSDGIRAEFTLMTIGDGRTTLPSNTSRSTVREPSHGAAAAPVTRAAARSNASMAPPPRASSRNSSRTSSHLGSRTNGSAFATARQEQDDSLFVPEHDDDQQWAPMDETNPDEDMLGWDASANDNSMPRGTFRNIEPRMAFPSQGAETSNDDGLEPTQRASEVKGLFD